MLFEKGLGLVRALSWVAGRRQLEVAAIKGGILHL